jgi:tetratricopeptide (TPR) repeat protein
MAELAATLFDKDEIETQIIRYTDSSKEKKSIFENALKLITDEKYIRNINILKNHCKNILHTNYILEPHINESEIVHEIINKKGDQFNDQNVLRILEDDSLKEKCKNTIIHCDEVLKTNPKDFNIWQKKGFAHYILHEYDNAIKCLSKLIEIKPDDYSTLYSLGMIYLLKKDYKNSIESLEKALKLNPDEFYILYLLGDAYYYLEDYKKAMSFYHLFIDSTPDKSSAWYSLSACQYYLGEYKESYESFSQSLKFIKEFENYAVLQVKLQELSVLKVFSVPVELNILLKNTSSIEDRIEALCRLLLLGKFSVLIDTFESIFTSNDLTGINSKKLVFLLKAYTLNLFENPKDDLEIKILFNSWLKLIDLIFKQDLTKYKNHLFEFSIDFLYLNRNNHDALKILYNLFLEAKKEYSEITEMIPQILNYFINPQDRESQKLIADPLFAEIIKQIS